MKFLETRDFRWAPRVRRADIFGLYMSDAEGNLAEELLDAVGIGLFVRCETIRNVRDRDKKLPFMGWNMAKAGLYVKEGINTACCVDYNEGGPANVTRNVEHHVEGVLWA